MRVWYFILGYVLMASQATEGGQKALFSCKKCGTDHEKPIGNKCERLKLDKMECEEKRDLSKEGSVKKTYKGKTTVSTTNQDKMMEAMLASMTSFTEKLSAMEERISSLTKVRDSGETSVRKSHSREKKWRESADESQEPTFVTPHPVVQSDEGISYSRVFPDTAVTLKACATPTRAKNQKGDTNLGVTPLTQEFILPTPVTASSSFSRATSTITRPMLSLMISQVWESGMSNLQETNNDISTVNKQPSRDFNQNIQSCAHTRYC